MTNLSTTPKKGHDLQSMLDNFENLKFSDVKNSPPTTFEIENGDYVVTITTKLNSPVELNVRDTAEGTIYHNSVTDDLLSKIGKIPLDQPQFIEALKTNNDNESVEFKCICDDDGKQLFTLVKRAHIFKKLYYFLVPLEKKEKPKTSAEAKEFLRGILQQE